MFNQNNIDMWNLLKPQKKKTEKELRDLSATFSILDTFEKCEALYWQRKGKALLVSEVLGRLKLAEGRDGFLRFLNQVSMWQNYRLLAEAYESLRLKVETEAVRKARTQFAMLTKADMQRIRQNARENMEMIPPERLDYIKEFDIFILRAGAPSAELATEENGQLLAIGHFDGEKVEMAMYDDVKYNLFKPEEHD
jgi:hypothetical protein